MRQGREPLDPAYFSYPVASMLRYACRKLREAERLLEGATIPEAAKQPEISE